MSGIASSFGVSPVSKTVAAAAISHTTVATSDTVAYLDKPTVSVMFQNTTNTAVNLVHLPILIAGNGTTVAGTAGYLFTVPAASFMMFDRKANGVHWAPAVYKVYADGTPSSGTFAIMAEYNK